MDHHGGPVVFEDRDHDSVGLGINAGGKRRDVRESGIVGLTDATVFPRVLESAISISVSMQPTLAT